MYILENLIFGKREYLSKKKRKPLNVKTEKSQTQAKWGKG